jgi:tetratricopeptide (TPR) repeat protein
MEMINVPEHDGVDYTYSSRVSNAADFFFDLENCSFPWIAALDGQGQGLVQLSTPELVGRKLWVWGKGPGGRNWQRFLSPPGKGYIEIQAGLTRSQLEHKPLPAGAAFSWLEAYGFLEADPDLVHGEAWTRAVQHVDERVQGLISPQALTREYLRGAEYEDQTPVEIFQIGSGWGALELRRREIISKRDQQVSGLVFGDESLAADQAPWLTLLENAAFPALDEIASPGSFVSVEGWGKWVEKSLGGKSADNWYAWYQAGNLRYHSGDLTAAEQAWQHSLDLKWSPWAARNLAQLAWRAGELNQAADLFIQACRKGPAGLPLVIECGKCLNQAGRYHEWLQIFNKLPQSLQSNGRIRFLQAKAGLAVGNLTTVEKYFNEQGIFSDLREGENSISDLWVEYQVQKMCMEEDLSENDTQVIQFRENPPVPEEIDFRMR